MDVEIDTKSLYMKQFQIDTCTAKLNRLKQKKVQDLEVWIH